jgi:hypothetical protein
MAVTVSAVQRLGRLLSTFTVQATADADVTTGNVAHGLGFIPDFVIITPLLPEGVLKRWSWDVANTDATNIVLIGANVVGSGAATPQIRCWCGTIHSLVR